MKTLRRIVKETCCDSGTVTHVVREYSFNFNLGAVFVKVYTSSFPLRYSRFAFSRPLDFINRTCHLSGKELYDYYFRYNDGILPRPISSSLLLSRPKYFGKNGRPLAAYHRI